MKKMANNAYSFFTQNFMAKSFSYYSMSQGINAVVSFLILGLYTAYLSPGDYGIISLIWIFVTVASIVIDGRLNTAFSIKYYKSSKDENITHIYTVFVYNLFIFIVFFFFFLAFPSTFESIMGVQIPSSYLIIIFLLIFFMIIGNFFTNLLMISKNPKLFMIATVIFNAVLIASSMIFLVFLEGGYISYMISYLASYFVLAMIGVVYLLYNYRPNKNNIFCLGRLKNLLSVSLPLVPDALLLMLLTWADRYVLNLYEGLAIVGIYSVGYVFAGVINSFIIAPFGQALSPIIFEQYVKAREEYRRTLGLVFKYYWVIVMTITMAYFVVLNEVFQLIIAPEYFEGYNIIGIVILGIVIGGAANLLGATIIMKEKTKIMFVFTSISVALNIILNFLLIPSYGMYGAAIATLFSYLIHFMIIFIFTQKLVYVKYDYGFIFKTTFISLIFLTAIIFVSTLDMGDITLLAMKMFIFAAYVLTIYCFKDVRNLLKGALYYVNR